MFNSGIYCIVDKVNEKQYVGRGVDLTLEKEKVYNLLKENKHPNKELQNSWNINYEADFDYVIVLYCPVNDLSYYEFFVNNHFEYNSYNKLTTDCLWKHDLNNAKMKELYLSHVPLTDISKVLGYSEEVIIKRLSKILGSDFKINNEDTDEVEEVEEEEELIIDGWDYLRTEFVGKIDYESEDTFLTRSLEFKLNISKKTSKTGIFRVRFHQHSNLKQGFSYDYYYNKSKKTAGMSSIDLFKLKNKIIDKGLAWIILDSDKAKKTLSFYNKYNKTGEPTFSFKLWDEYKVAYDMSNCTFDLRWNTQDINLDIFIEFLSPTIIHDLIINEFI